MRLVDRLFNCSTAEKGPIIFVSATGTNASYMEKAAKVKYGLAQASEPYNYDQMIIDTEWGGFGDRNEALSLKLLTAYDIHVDNSSEHPGVNT